MNDIIDSKIGSGEPLKQKEGIDNKTEISMYPDGTNLCNKIGDELHCYKEGDLTKDPLITKVDHIDTRHSMEKFNE